MKNVIIILLFTLAGINVQAQSQEIPLYIGTPQSAVHVGGRLYVDTLLVLPYTDTIHIASPVSEGAYIYQKTDNTLYIFNGYYWKQVVTKDAVDSIYARKSYFHIQPLYGYSNSTFTLMYPPDLSQDFEITIQGVTQNPSSYTVSGRVVTLDGTTHNDDITIKYYSNEK